MPDPVPYVRSLRMALVAGALVAGAGPFILLAWFSGATGVTNLRDGWQPMVPITATCFFLSGAALMAVTRGMARDRAGEERQAMFRRRVGMALGVLVAVIGARRLVYYAAGWRSEIDMFGLSAHAGPGQMAWTAGLGFLLGGSALALTARRGFYAVGQVLAGLVFFIGWATLVRYLHGGSMQSWPFLTSVNTAACFAVLGLGVFFARPDAGLVRVWNSHTAGGTLVRGLLPAALVVPVVLGWLRLQGELFGWYGFEAGLTIFALSNVAVFVVLVWHTALRLHREGLRRQGAERAERYERYFSDALLDSLPGVFYLYDREGRFLRWNHQFESVTGYTSAEIGRMRPDDFFNEEDRPALRERVARVFTDGRADLEADFRSRDGSTRPYYFTGVRVELAGAPCLAGVGIDIGDRREAERAVHKLNAELEQRVAERTAELQAKNRELETFTYSVSHDLKAPLRGIDGYSRLLMEDYDAKLDDEGRRFLRAVRGAAAQMGQLIDDLLSYSQLERRAWQPRVVPLSAMIDEILARHEEEIARRKIEVVQAIPAGLEVWADAQGLGQSLRNLIENALKFTAAGSAPRVEIGARLQDGVCLVWVRDNGVGFDMRFAERIFEIFQRLHRAEDYPGTGIGLAIVRKAMERMGGRAWAISEPGRGATFYLELPPRP